MTRVVILGCGYVGCELARRLEDEVVGVRRSTTGLADVEAAGARAVRADITDAESLWAVPDPDRLIVAASAGGRDTDAARETYVDGLRTAIDHFTARSSPPDRVVYTSSTGVYGDHDGKWVDEETPLEPNTEREEILVEAERIARERPPSGIDGTVARLGGLYGPGRYRLHRYLEGPVTAGHRNMIHRDDAAGAIQYLLETDRARDQVVNIVDDEPVEKHAFADWLSDACGESPPPKRSIEDRLEADEGTAGRRITADKRVSNDRLRALGYEFVYPTFRDGYLAAVDAYRTGDTAL